MSRIQKVPWVQFVSKAMGYKFPSSILGLSILLLSIASVVWTVFEAAGLPGSTRVLMLIIAISFTFLAVMILTFRFLSWSLLFTAVKEYIRLNKLHNSIDADTILLGAGAGSALAVGMVSKALQELGHPIPHSFVIDCQYRGEARPQTGVLLPSDFKLPPKKCFIIHSYLGTGRSLECLKAVLGIKQAQVFCFVISEALVGREDIDHYLVVGERSIIPWGKSSP